MRAQQPKTVEDTSKKDRGSKQKRPSQPGSDRVERPISSAAA